MKLRDVLIHTTLFLIIVHFTLGERADGNGLVEITADEERRQLNNTQKAFDVFSITLGDEFEELGGSMSHTKDVVFRDGQVQKHWMLPSKSATSLFHHGSYVDRISFDFYFGSFPTEYDIRKPTIKSSRTNIAQPKVIDFQIDDESFTGSYTIVYDCQPHNESAKFLNTTIQVDLQVLKGHSIMYGLQKTCGGGFHKYVDFGYYIPTDHTGMEPVRSTFPAYNMVIGPHILGTRIFLLLNSPAETQEFFAITSSVDRRADASRKKVNGTKSSNTNGLEVNVQGPVFGGVLRKGKPTLLYITYDCKAHGKHRIILRVPLRPFKELVATWEKDCGGGVATGVHVGTTGVDDSDGFNNVVRAGVANASWLVGLSATSDRLSDEHEPVVVNTSTRVKDLWVSNRGISLYVGRHVVTVEKPDVLSVHTARSLVKNNGGILSGNSHVMNDFNAYSTSSSGSAYDRAHPSGSDGLLLPSNSKLRLRLRLICKKKGRSLVLLSLPIKSFNKVDLSFIKQCRAPRQIHHNSSFFSSANFSMIVLSIVFLVLTLTWLSTGPTISYYKDPLAKGDDGFVGRTIDHAWAYSGQISSSRKPPTGRMGNGPGITSDRFVGNNIV